MQIFLIFILFVYYVSLYLGIQRRDYKYDTLKTQYDIENSLVKTFFSYQRPNISLKSLKWLFTNSYGKSSQGVILVVV